MSTFLIRPAVPNDAGQIAFIHKQAWPDDSPDREMIANALRQLENRAHLALLDGLPVGYVDGFPTRSLLGKLRWELDLLAMVPAAQGRGCGRELARRSLQDGVEAGARVARALIQQDNPASQTALEHTGFTAVPGWYELWTAACGKVLPPSLEVFAIPVQTYNYIGWWLEGDPGPGVFASAGPSIENESGTFLLGALLPVEETATIRAAREANFGLRGIYGWWERRFGTDA